MRCNFEKARYTYKRYNSGYDKMFMKNCCNFKLLEEKCLEYQAYLDTAREVAAVKEEDMDIEKEIKGEENYEMER